MKIIKDIPQGSEEWHKLRLGIPTASNFSKVITSGGKPSTQLKKYALQLATELLLTEQEETYANEDMLRGNELEGEAREAYQEYSFNYVEQVTFIRCDNWGYSPDGLIEKNGLLEIKCPKASTHTKYLYEDRLPSEYKAQCQGGLLCSEREYLDFVSYHPDFKEGKTLFIKRVYRDEEFISSLHKLLQEAVNLRDEYFNKIMKGEA